MDCPCMLQHCQGAYISFFFISSYLHKYFTNPPISSVLTAAAFRLMCGFHSNKSFILAKYFIPRFLALSYEYMLPFGILGISSNSGISAYLGISKLIPTTPMSSLVTQMNFQFKPQSVQMVCNFTIGISTPCGTYTYHEYNCQVMFMRFNTQQLIKLKIRKSQSIHSGFSKFH